VGLVSSFQTASGTTGTMADVWFAAQVLPGGATSTVTTSANLSSGALSNSVSGLANAISSFNQGVSSPLSTTVSLDTGGASSAATGVLSANLASTLNAMSQFNANGQALGVVSSSSTLQVPISLNTSGVNSTSPSTLAVPNKKSG